MHSLSVFYALDCMGCLSDRDGEMKERDKECEFNDICEEMHGENGDCGFIDCPSADKCLSPYNEYFEGAYEEYE